MPSREFYQQEAKRLFDMALMARDPVVRARWIERANQYLMLADAVDDQPAPAVPSVTSQRQPMQQQQQKKQDDE